jgi:hypothetical protein
MTIRDSLEALSAGGRGQPVGQKLTILIFFT